MKGSGLGFEEVAAADTILVGWDGSVLAGDRPRHLEYPIHTEVLAARSDVNAVVHTHAHYAVAFGALGIPLRPISHDACFFGTEGVAHFTATGDLIVSPELGRSVAEALGVAGACFLVNHGVVVAGADVASATIGALLLERACRTQLTAMSAGGWATWSTEAETAAKHVNCYPPTLVAQAWEYCRRQGGEAT
jgi:L-fuculose-phosphate aldolase